MQQPAYSGIENLELMSEAENYNRYLLRIVRAHAPAQGAILDFGAGSGQFALPLMQTGHDVTALEPDNALRGKICEKGIRAFATLDQLSNHSFHYVYTLNVLEHIPDDVEALRHLHSKLVWGGTLLIYVPAFPALYTSMDAKVGHVRRYTRKTLLATVQAAGFSVERTAYVDSLGFFATLLFKAIGDSRGEINRHALKLYDRVVFPLSRIMDLATWRWFGKNLLLIARSGMGSSTENQA